MGGNLVKRLGVSFVLVAIAALGWGYWHSATHATLNLYIHDVSLKTDRQAFGSVKQADIVFMNAEGAVLAEGRIREPYGVLSVSHPEAGDCSRYERQVSSNPEARDAWQRCFEALSRWLASWVREVRYATVTMRNCRIEKMTVVLREYGDTWWLWWVPLPHIGGKPYTGFTLTLTVDGCRPQHPDQGSWKLNFGKFILRGGACSNPVRLESKQHPLFFASAAAGVQGLKGVGNRWDLDTSRNRIS